MAALLLPGYRPSSLFGFADAVAMANDFIDERVSELPAGLDHIVGRLGIDFLDASGAGPISAVRGFGDGRYTALEPGEDDYDLVFLPDFRAVNPCELERTLTQAEGLCDWLKARHADGAKIAANGSGVFLLAHTGLLDHRTATVTPAASAQFRRLFPRVALDTSRQVTEADRLFCAASLGGNLQLACRLLLDVASQNIAVMTARQLFGHARQDITPTSPVAIADGTEDEFAARVQNWLAQNYARRVTIASLAKAMAVSPRTLIRRCKASLGMMPGEYVRKLRIETAKQFLWLTDLPVEQIPAVVGYQDVGSFKRVFHRATGQSMGQFRATVRADPPAGQRN